MGSVATVKKLLEIFTDTEPEKAAAHPFITEFLRQSKNANRRAKAIIAPMDSESTETLSRRRHDLQSAIRTLIMASDSLSEGYRFEDARGKSKIAAIAKAVKVIESEGELALGLLDW